MKCNFKFYDWAGNLGLCTMIVGLPDSRYIVKYQSLSVVKTASWAPDSCEDDSEASGLGSQTLGSWEEMAL